MDYTFHEWLARYEEMAMPQPQVQKLIDAMQSRGMNPTMIALSLSSNGYPTQPRQVRGYLMNKKDVKATDDMVIPLHPKVAPPTPATAPAQTRRDTPWDGKPKVVNIPRSAKGIDMYAHLRPPALPGDSERSFNYAQDDPAHRNRMASQMAYARPDRVRDAMRRMDLDDEDNSSFIRSVEY